MVVRPKSKGVVFFFKDFVGKVFRRVPGSEKGHVKCWLLLLLVLLNHLAHNPWTNFIFSIHFPWILVLFKSFGYGAPAWLSRWSVQLWLRSWSPGSWVWAPNQAHYRQRTAHFGSSVFLSLSFSLKNKHFKKTNKKPWLPSVFWWSIKQYLQPEFLSWFSDLISDCQVGISIWRSQTEHTQFFYTKSNIPFFLSSLTE